MIGKIAGKPPCNWKEKNGKMEQSAGKLIEG
jgi:hypothetical protein